MAQSWAIWCLMTCLIFGGHDYNKLHNCIHIQWQEHDMCEEHRTIDYRELEKIPYKLKEIYVIADDETDEG